jgi:hypothetical protein
MTVRPVSEVHCWGFSDNIGTSGYIVATRVKAPRRTAVVGVLEVPPARRWDTACARGRSRGQSEEELPCTPPQLRAISTRQSSDFFERRAKLTVV